MADYIIRQRDRGQAEAKTSRPRPRPKFWPRGHFGLEDLTSLVVIKSPVLSIHAPVALRHGSSQSTANFGYTPVKCRAISSMVTVSIERIAVVDQNCIRSSRAYTTDFTMVPMELWVFDKNKSKQASTQICESLTGY